MREQAVTTAQVNHPSAAKKAARSPRQFPGFVQFLAGQAAGFAHGTAKTIKECLGGKAVEIVRGQPSARRM